MLIDNETGDMLPKGKPDHFLVEDSAAVGKILDWDVAVITKLPMAAGVPTGDNVEIRGVSFCGGHNGFVHSGES